jgi:hypothetical protein
VPREVWAGGAPGGDQGALVVDHAVEDLDVVATEAVPLEEAAAGPVMSAAGVAEAGGPTREGGMTMMTGMITGRESNLSSMTARTQ